MGWSTPIKKVAVFLSLRYDSRMRVPRLVFAALCFVLTPVTLHAQDLLPLVPGALSSDSALDAAQERLRGATSISLVDGLDLARKYVAVRAYEVLAPSAATLLHEDDERRYVIDRNILVTTGDDARICALTIRPRQATGRLTAL